MGNDWEKESEDGPYTSWEHICTLAHGQSYTHQRTVTVGWTIGSEIKGDVSNLSYSVHMQESKAEQITFHGPSNSKSGYRAEHSQKVYTGSVTYTRKVTTNLDDFSSYTRTERKTKNYKVKARIFRNKKVK
eukprot:264724_1